MVGSTAQPEVLPELLRFGRSSSDSLQQSGAEYERTVGGEAPLVAMTVLLGGSISGADIDRSACGFALKGAPPHAVPPEPWRSSLLPAACSRLYRLRTASSLLPGMRDAILIHWLPWATTLLRIIASSSCETEQ